MQNGRDRGCRNGGAGVCGQTVEDGCDSLQMPVCGSAGGGGNLYGSGMGYHGNILLKSNVGAGEAEIEGLIYWEEGAPQTERLILLVAWNLRYSGK